MSKYRELLKNKMNTRLFYDQEEEFILNSFSILKKLLVDSEHNLLSVLR
jgi:hypothetical protein